MPRHPLSSPSPAQRLPLGRPVNRRPPLAYRPWASGKEQPATQGELAREPRLAALEAALLLADEPLTARRLARVAGLADAGEARRLVGRLRALYDADGTAFQVEELAGGYQLLTRAEFHPWLARLRRAYAPAQLSAAAREALAIVAYRQPVTRADVEAIRGVGSAEVLRQLMDRDLVRLAGRDTSLGRPQLYATTTKFLQVFGLKSLKDLPQVEGLTPPGGRVR